MPHDDGFSLKTRKTVQANEVFLTSFSKSFKKRIPPLSGFSKLGLTKQKVRQACFTIPIQCLFCFKSLIEQSLTPLPSPFPSLGFSDSEPSHHRLDGHLLHEIRRLRRKRRYAECGRWRVGPQRMQEPIYGEHGVEEHIVHPFGKCFLREVFF